MKLLFPVSVGWETWMGGGGGGGPALHVACPRGVGWRLHSSCLSVPLLYQHRLWHATGSSSTSSPYRCLQLRISRPPLGCAPPPAVGPMPCQAIRNRRSLAVKLRDLTAATPMQCIDEEACRVLRSGPLNNLRAIGKRRESAHGVRIRWSRAVWLRTHRHLLALG